MGNELISFDGNMQMRSSGLYVDDVKAMKKRLDLLIEAISMCHDGGEGAECSPRCMACRVEEAMRSIKVAEKLGAADG